MRSGDVPTADAIPITRTLIPRIEALLALHPRRASEYRAANLYLYRARHDYRLLEDGEGGAMIGTTYDGERHALPFGPVDAARAFRLLDHADCLFPLDAIEAEALCAAAGLAMDFRAADSDYLYAADALSHLAGAKAKRTQASAFAAEAAPQMVRLLGGTLAQAESVLQGWSEDVGRAPEATDIAECREALATLDALRLEAWLVLGRGEPVGFLIAGAAQEGERVVHFAKGRRAHAGVYPWMFAHYAARSGAGTLNFEQDLGNPGLAQSKRALAPSRQRHKYRVRKSA